MLKYYTVLYSAYGRPWLVSFYSLEAANSWADNVRDNGDSKKVQVIMTSDYFSFVSDGNDFVEVM